MSNKNTKIAIAKKNSIANIDGKVTIAKNSGSSHEKFYRVFVSSTYKDLKEERQQAFETLLSSDFFPCGMEYFGPWSNDTWSLIQKNIDSCDYYLLIIGNRYGSLYDGKESYTEKEYRYAIEKKITCMAFINDNLGSSNESLRNKKKLLNFGKDVEDSSTYKNYWNSVGKLTAGITRTIADAIVNCPARGWIRGKKNKPSKSNKVDLSGPDRSGTINDMDFLSTQIEIVYDVSSDRPKFKRRADKSVTVRSLGTYIKSFSMPMTWAELFIFFVNLILHSSSSVYSLNLELTKKCVAHYMENHSEDYNDRISYENNEAFKICVESLNGHVLSYFKINPELINTIRNEFYLKDYFTSNTDDLELTYAGKQLFEELRPRQ